jgi:hypothetical protein
MRNAFLPLAAVSLFSPTFFVALQTPPSAQAPVSASQQQGEVRKAVPESCPVTKPPATAFVPPQPLLDKSWTRRLLVWHAEPLDTLAQQWYLERSSGRDNAQPEAVLVSGSLMGVGRRSVNAFRKCAISCPVGPMAAKQDLSFEQG